jgi:hypothetical protein
MDGDACRPYKYLKSWPALSAATQNDAPGVLVQLRRTKTPESSK